MKNFWHFFFNILVKGAPWRFHHIFYFVIVNSIVNFSAVLSVWVAKKYFNTIQLDPSSSLSNWHWTVITATSEPKAKRLWYVFWCIQHKIKTVLQSKFALLQQKHSCQKGPVNHSVQLTNQSSAVIHIRQMATGSHVERSQAAGTTSPHKLNVVSCSLLSEYGPGQR